MTKQFSVIIPVYNAEKYLRRCLDSLYSQQHENAEIIMVNDGSSDGSGMICQEYAEADPAFLYYEKENGGVSSRRSISSKRCLLNMSCMLTATIMSQMISF